MKKYGLEICSIILLFTGISLQASSAAWFTPTVMFIWYACALLPVAIPVWKEAWETMRKGDIFNEFTLMSIASIGAFCIEEYPEGVAVMLFYSIGERFQDAAVGKARSQIQALLDIRPDKASLLQDGEYVTVHPETVLPGNEIGVKAGERVPLDGTLLTEYAIFQTAALTGESMPRIYRQGESVPSGIIVTDRTIHIKVTKPYAESTLSRMLEMVQNAAERKAPAELFIRKFARIYTPTVTTLAALIVVLPFLYSCLVPNFQFVFSDWFYRALVFLVISCPCALVISIPLSYFGGIGAASRKGILFKGGNYLDAITRLHTVIFDKTGTLTEGTFRVQQVCPNEATEQELWEWVATLEKQSNHPIAKAIVEEAEQKGYKAFHTNNVSDIAGMGLEGTFGEQHLLIGNTRLMASRSITYPKTLEEIPDTIVLCAVDGEYKGYLLLADSAKEDAKATVKGLKSLNINNIQILSGDKQPIVRNLAKQLGIENAYGNLLPEGKVHHVEEQIRLGNRPIAFVGDGLNDAPVLAISDVGIAMGGLGSDAAIETADVVIQNDRPSQLLTAIRIGKATRHIVWQNIFLALGVKGIVLLMGALGIASLWAAVFADVGVALLAILNAMRIQRFNG